MKSMVEITFEAPCDGRLDQILEWIDAEPSTRDQPIASHLRTCGRCRAFAESLRHERGAVRSSFPRISTAAPQNAMAGIDTWLRRNFEIRSDEQLARAITSVARAVMRRNADYSDRVTTTLGSIEASTTTQQFGELKTLAQVVAMAHAGSETLSLPSIRVGSIFKKVSSAVKGLDETQRVDIVARNLVNLAIQVSPRCSLAWNLLGNIAWFFGPESDVGLCFGKAQKLAASDVEIAMALVNLSVLAVDSGDINTTFRLSEASLLSMPTLLGQVNRMIWCRCFGRTAESERLMRSLDNRASSRAVTRLLRPTVVRRQVESLAMVYGIAVVKRERIIKDLNQMSAMLIVDSRRLTSTMGDT